jgi:hypothetical protein
MRYAILRGRARLLLAVFFVLGMTIPARAHIGSKDVFEQISVGPYKLYVTIRTPTVIPGVATLEIRSFGTQVDSIRITPIPLTGEASKHPPTADPMNGSLDDPAFFTGSVWLMASGAWQVRLQIAGAAGPATIGVPVPAIPLSILPMQRPLGITLAMLGLILALGMAGIVAAAVRESRLPPGTAPPSDRRRRAAIAATVTLLFMAAIIVFGGWWWHVEAAGYAKDIYHSSDLHIALNGNRLDLSVGDYNEKKKKWDPDSTDDFLLDHGKIMHLYAIRQPGMDSAFHLHPEPVSIGDSDIDLQTILPTMPPGNYKLYADVVYRNGFADTLTASLTIPPGLPQAPLAPDDASALPPPLANGDLGTAYKLPDGYNMVWDRPGGITAGTPYSFLFRLLDPTGKPATDIQPYLGMAGHAAFVKTDGTAFAHTHPEGSAAMPAFMLANPEDPATGMGGDANGMPGMTQPISPTVEFPYGFPTPGRYRIFIQMKHGAVVETGVFDAEVH